MHAKCDYQNQMIQTLEGEDIHGQFCLVVSLRVDFKNVHCAVMPSDETPPWTQLQTEDEVEKDEYYKIAAVALTPSSRELESIFFEARNHPRLDCKQKPELILQVRRQSIGDE